MIKHYIITHENEQRLSENVNSLLNSTLVAQDIIIVWNGKKSVKSLSLERELADFDYVNFFYVGYNAFIFGVTLAMKVYQNVEDPYFLVSDGDFLYPPLATGDWLQEFIFFMDKFPMIGRTGLSIDLINIKSKPELISILQQEEKYLSGFCIDEFYHAPIDTTPAIYRKNIFYWGNNVMPGHMTGMKPYFLSMRSKNFFGYHLGWDEKKYQSGHYLLSWSNLTSFGMFNGVISNTVLSQQPLIKKFVYKLISAVARTYWRSFKFFYILKYLLKKKFVFTNELAESFND